MKEENEHKEYYKVAYHPKKEYYKVACLLLLKLLV